MDSQTAMSLLGFRQGERVTDAQDLKRRYQRLVTIWHPDRFHGDPETAKYASDQLAQINSAYALLRESLDRNTQTPVDSQETTAPAEPERRPPPADQPSPTDESVHVGHDTSSSHKPEAEPSPAAGHAGRNDEAAAAGRSSHDDARPRPPSSDLSPKHMLSLVFGLLAIIAMLASYATPPPAQAPAVEAPRPPLPGTVSLVDETSAVPITRRSLCLHRSGERGTRHDPWLATWTSPPLDPGLYTASYRVGAHPPVQWRAFSVSAGKTTRLDPSVSEGAAGGWQLDASKSTQNHGRVESISGHGDIVLPDSGCESDAVLTFFCDSARGVSAALSLTVVDPVWSTRHPVGLSQDRYDMELNMLRAGVAMPCDENVVALVDGVEVAALCASTAQRDSETLLALSAAKLLNAAVGREDNLLSLRFSTRSGWGTATFSTYGLRLAFASSAKDTACFRKRVNQFMR